MKIISFIVQAEVIRKILVHLDQWEAYTQERAPAEFPRAEALKAQTDSRLQREVVDD